MTEYKKGQVGIMRHPEIYQEDQPIIPSVEIELALWEHAETLHKFTKDLTDVHFMFIMHYIMALRKMSDDTMYLWHEWMQMKIIESHAKQVALTQIGQSACQLAKQRLEK